MGNNVTVTVKAKSACLQGESFEWQGQFLQGTSLIEAFTLLAKSYSFVKDGFFDVEKKKMFAYHLVFVNGSMLLPKDFNIYTFRSDVDIKVVPCVTGG